MTTKQLYGLYSEHRDVCTDTRAIRPGCIFFGLRGERFDGSAFAGEALDRGAAFAVVRPGFCQDQRVIAVTDPLQKLQQLAHFHRRQLTIPVLGITGSNGKTTTKELIGHVLSSTYRTCMTEGNLNNHIGVPLTILSIARDTEMAIVEMGANHRGEIAALSSIAEPTHGIVTNVGKAHLEGFGSFEGVKKAKAELYDALAASGGVAFVSRDESYLTALSEDVQRRIFYRMGETPAHSDWDMTFGPLETMPYVGMTFCDHEHKEWVVRSEVFGAYNAANIAAAIAIGLYFNVPPSAICREIGMYQPQNNRSERRFAGSNEIILDAYNANPTSMALAISSFAAMPGRKKIMILGAMFELGEFSAEEHMAIATKAAGIPDTDTYLIGDDFKASARHTGLTWYADTSSALEALKEQRIKHALILLKGSRALSLERLCAAFE